MTAGHGEKRGRREEQAIAALLSEPTIEAAAKKAGISESSLLRWMAVPSFQERYRAARRQVVEHAVSRLQQATSEAVDALQRNLTCGTPAAEIAAAKATIDFSLKAIELTDLAERIEQLEQLAPVAGKEPT